MKKEDLVAKGLTEEQAKSVIDLWNEGMKGLIPKGQLDEVSGKLKEANATIETLKKNNADNGELQKQVEQYKGKVASLEKAAENARKEFALKEKLAAAGVLDADYVIYKHGGVEKFAFDKEGVPVGIEDVVKPLRESSPHLFKGQAGYSPAGGTAPTAANPWAKETFNLTEQGRIFKENPAQARQMAAAAGATI